MRVVIGTKSGRCKELSRERPPSPENYGLLWPVEPERQQVGLERNFNADAQGRFRQDAMARTVLRLRDGRDGTWMLTAEYPLLSALKSRCVTLELTEGGPPPRKSRSFRLAIWNRWRKMSTAAPRQSNCA